jgi:hypothetical protein
MAKDLPYFKFFCSEWSDGDITLEDYETQGFFINVCSYYWSNNCDIELVKVKKRFRNDELLDKLIETDIIKIKGSFIVINFLDLQLEEREKQSAVKSKGGKASAEAKKLLKIQQQFSKDSTENQHVLKSCSTESQVLREEKRREEEKRKEKIIINNAVFSNECKYSEQWIEITSMQNKVKPEAISFFIDNFESHLITMEEQKKTLKEFKEHFSHWLRKQDMSVFKTKVLGKSNQL